MDRLLAEHSDLIVSGTVENQGRFYDRFNHVVLLSAPLQVLIDRVRLRTNNPYGKSVQQKCEIARYIETVEPLLRKVSTLELDSQRPVSELADAVERLMAPPSHLPWSQALPDRGIASPGMTSGRFA